MEIYGRCSLVARGCGTGAFAFVGQCDRSSRIIMINYNGNNNEMMYRGGRKLVRKMATEHRHLLQNAARTSDAYIDERNVFARVLSLRVEHKKPVSQSADQSSGSPPGRDITNPRRYRAGIKCGTLIGVDRSLATMT